MIKHNHPDLPKWFPTLLATEQPSPWSDYLPASPHHLTTTSSGPALPHKLSPRRDQYSWLRAVSITRFSMGATLPVREYQPVVHRLRLSASPSVPTYPGRMNLALEPLVFRRTCFSHVFRYSCLHSHSCGVHGWITPPLHSPHDALLPINTAGPRRPTKNVNATTSVACLSPVTLSARNHLTSELLRTLSRVAASKPTSWLSMQLHILSHLAHA